MSDPRRSRHEIREKRHMGVRFEEFCANGEEFRMQQFQHAVDDRRMVLTEPATELPRLRAR